MKNIQVYQESNIEYLKTIQKTENLNQDIKESWEIIAPFWPLHNLIAINPLQGLENLTFEEALLQGDIYFEKEYFSSQIEEINRITIKWMQVLCDLGQATIAMPNKKEGLYTAWLKLIRFDEDLHQNDRKKQEWLKFLPKSSIQAIAECLLRLSIKKEDRKKFMTLMLTTLHGWASHIKYLNNWQEEDNTKPVSQSDYLALRLIITCLIWPDAKNLLDLHKQLTSKTKKSENILIKIIEAEEKYRLPLLKQISSQSLPKSYVPKVQLLFCIDVRSEPFRRALERITDYETFGFAGFFGVPVKIENDITGENYASCPVLLKTKHSVVESPNCSHDSFLRIQKGYKKISGIKILYQSLKYNFTTPFALVEALGLWSGAWMILQSFFPFFAYRLKNLIANTINPKYDLKPNIKNISFKDQCSYAEEALKMIGLTRNFAPLIVLCGHGSKTNNNAFASALDCGACGGRHGASNARIMAEILNDVNVRKALEEKQIIIPTYTRFIAAEHNTTNDEVNIYNNEKIPELSDLKKDLEKARHQNNLWRCKEMKYNGKNCSNHTLLRSYNWAEVRPEWGLARNASFIVAPRQLSKNINLEGRAFLHSYDYQQDPTGESLTAILTAPMVVAQWINSQYLFSTLNNIAYGAGSKITKNITGKFGIMQGNASDLMTGLPFQSVYESDNKNYHEMQRLMTVVFAPKEMINRIIDKQSVLQKLFGNGWVTLACVDPQDNKTYFLQQDLMWKRVL